MTDGDSVAGVLLAGGDSDRFADGDKLLARLDGETLVCRAARTLTDAPPDGVAAVVDPESGVGPALASRLPGVTRLPNPAAAAGQASSVRRGVAWARSYDAVVFALGDMPRVRPSTVAALVRAWRDGRGSALAAGHEGQRGNPVLFDRRHFDALARLSGDVGGREVFATARDSAVVETGDPGALVDVDTRADLAKLAARDIPDSGEQDE